MPAAKSARFFFRGKLNARRPGPVTALDVEGQTLRIAQAARRGNRTGVSRVETCQLERDDKAALLDAEALGKAVAEALADLRIKPAQIVMGVPRQSVILRNLSVPFVSDLRELASIVHLQVGKELPFRPEEAVIDFKVRPQAARLAPASESAPGIESAGPAAKLDVLAAVVRRDTVNFYERVAAAAKLKLVGLGWLSQANARCLEACQGALEDGGVALVSLRPEAMAIDIIAEQSLLFSRGAVLQATRAAASSEEAQSSPEQVAAAPALSPPESYVDAVTIEVVRSLHSYGGSEASTPVAKVVVAGATGREREVLEALQQRLRIPCTLLDPARALELPEAGRRHAADAIGVIGLVLGVNDAEGLPFDFLNPKRPAVQRNMRRIRTLALAAAGAALLIGMLAIRRHLVSQREKIRDQLQIEVSAAEKKMPTYRRMQQQAAAIQTWSKDTRDWLEHYAHLSAILPGSEELYITSFSVSGQGNIHLAVQARSGEILAKLDRQLREAGYDVKPLAINPGNEKHGYNFRSTVELIVPAKMKVDLSKISPPVRPEDDGSLDGNTRPSSRKGGRS